MEDNALILFLRETLTRIFTKSPKFFRVWQFIAALLLASAKLPELINALSILGVHLPEVWNTRVRLIVTCCSSTLLFASRLTTQSKLSVDKDGEITKKTDPNKLPYTAAHEEKQVLKEAK